VKLPAFVAVLVVLSSAVMAEPSNAPRGVPQSRTLLDAVYVRPLYGAFRHCGGSCLKSGSLSWFCFEKQECYLSCATAPAVMKCALQ
jgi:hypothetical protein